MARNTLAALMPAYHVAGLELHCTPSLGISLFPRDGDTIGHLMQQADLAMYHAKQVCPGHFQFVTDALNDQARTTATLEKHLREGLAQRELRLAYQPMLDVQHGCLTGVEALLRWPQQDRDEIAPSTFLPVAESIHMMHEIGQWVFEEVCRQHRVWLSRGLPPIPIAVNVSARQFHHPQFRQGLVTACQHADVDPALLTLQLSEATLMEDLQVSQHLLSELKSLGVRLVMDDFGLGCNSLRELENLPLDELQINRVLVERLHIARGMPAIINSIIHLCRAFQFDITAVGIESEADLQFFHANGCDQVQGFLLGAPMSGDAFTDWYRQRPAPSPQA